VILVAGVDKLCIFIDSADLAKKYGRVSPILQKSPDRRCDLSGRKHRGRRLIEQRLKEVVIRSINHNDIGVNESREMLMRREIVEVADGFTFRGVAQHTTACKVAEGPQHASNRLGCWTVYC